GATRSVADGIPTRSVGTRMGGSVSPHRSSAISHPGPTPSPRDCPSGPCEDGVGGEGVAEALELGDEPLDGFGGVGQAAVAADLLDAGGGIGGRAGAAACGQALEAVRRPLDAAGVVAEQAAAELIE